MLRPSAAVGLILLTAGCLSSTPGGQGNEPGDGFPVPDPAPGDISGPPGPDASVRVCTSSDGCTFWDDDYHEYTVYELDTANLDVLIIPPASPAAVDQTVVMSKAVQAWADGINRLGAEWFRTGFHLNLYVIGQDTPPAEALADPEIIVVGAEANPALLFGIGLEPKQLACNVVGKETLRPYTTHTHDGMEIQAADCTGIGFLCVAINTNFLNGGNIYLQDLVAHEVGHCLGGGHVGDALDFSSKIAPVQDIMSYQHDATHVHCVSNMNVRVLEDVYAALLQHPEADQRRAGDYTTFDPSSYRYVLCANP